MTEQNEIQASIDEPTMKEIMGYFKIENHDEFASYIKSLGIAHND
ncbi:MAG TPA: hypothetical protein VLA68_06045 [Nitrososphaera sp.]|nr:hypothetical protein [Nitrososphaera sp.]